MKRSSTLIYLFIIGILYSACQPAPKPKGNETIKKEILKTNEKPPKAIISEDQIHFAGTWTARDAYPIVNLKIEADGTFTVKEVYGMDETRGTIYQAEYKNGQVIALGDEKNFYKWTLPTFKFTNDLDKLEFITGVGPLELVKTNIKMPDINYTAPENND